MNGWVVAVSALLLAPERLAYVAIYQTPGTFARASRKLLPVRMDPVAVLTFLFVGFKLLQALVFTSWCVLHGGGLGPASTDVRVLATGLTLVAAGQFLNLSVFHRLGSVGVFYGNRLGHDVRWHEGFPFSWFRHPQYVGVVVSIWGLFVTMRYPAPDWFAIPLIETLYYVAGASFEDERATDRWPSRGRRTVV